MSHSPLLDRIEAREARLAIIGLGYVGLPLAVEFGKHFDVAGFDISTRRLEELRAGRDRTLETTVEELRRARRLSFTNRIGDLKEVDVFIVTVPTPIDRHKRPDLTPLVKASETVGQALKPGGVVVYESTVYP
ncbi:MAG TPA: Vi polysaccharide biosynthesis UDP-N-acetylglucosamine C-6 dehydrogenase TviB, partial [Kiritimatiellia bacterium]|nr:Vi polysaccharide biosynthesis UDP-N-acetylglucosamine C-6 dehydrogenase TviB [Kiritimatiellia bacterium]